MFFPPSPLSGGGNNSLFLTIFLLLFRSPCMANVEQQQHHRLQAAPGLRINNIQDAKASGQTESAPFLGPKLERKPKRPELDGMLLDRAAILAQQRARGRRIESLDSVLDRKKKEEKIEKQKEMEESNWKMAHRYSQGYTKPDTFGLEKAESENLNKIATDDGTVPTNNNGQLGNGIGQQPNIGANAVNEGGHNGIGAINERTNNGIGHNIGANAGSQVYNDIEHAGAVNEGAKNGIPHNIGADAVNIGSNGIGPNGAGAEAHNDGAHHSGAVTEGKNGIQHNSRGTADAAGIPFNHAEMPFSVNGEHSTMENGGDAVPENEEGMAEENVAGSKWNEEKAPANGHIAAEGMRHQEDVPLAQLLERHNPTAQMPEGHNPTAQMPEGQNPALTPEWHNSMAQLPEGQNPTAQLPEGQNPAQTEGHNPTAQLPEGHIPTAQLPEWHNPLAQFPEGQNPAQTPEGHNPTAQLPEGHIPTAQLPEGHNPLAQTEGHNPTAQMPEGHNPLAQTEGHIPTAQLSEGHNPTAQFPEGQNPAQTPEGHNPLAQTEGHIPTAQLPEGHNPIQQAFSNIVVDGEMPEWDTAQLPQEKLDWEKGVDANANLKRHDMEGERTKGVQIGEDRNAIVPYGMSPPKEVWHKTGPQSNDAIRLDEANNAIVPVGMPPGQNNAIVTPEMPSGQNNAIVQAKMPPGQNNAIVLPEMPLGQNNAIVPPEMPSGQNNAIVQAEMPPGQHNAIGMPSENVWHKEMALGNGGTNGHPNGAIVAHHGPSSMVKSGDHHQGPTAQNGGQNGIALAAKTAPATGHGRMEKQPAEFATQQCHVEKPKLVCTLDRHEFTFFIKLHDKAHLLELAKKCTHITLDVGNFLVDKGIKVENMIKRVEDKGKKEAHGENGRKMDEEERNWKNLKEFKQLIGDKVKLLAVWQFAKDSHKEAFKNQMKRGGQIVAKKGGTNAADRLALIKGIIDMAYHDLFDGFLLDFTGDFKFFNNHYAHLLRDFRLELVTKKMPKGRDRPIFAVRLDSDASMELDKTGQEFGENLKYADLVLTEEGKKDKKKAPLAFDPFAAIHAGKFAFPNLLVHKMKPDRGLIKMIGDGCKRIVLSIGMLHKELAAKAASNGGRSAAASAQATAFAHAAMAHAALARFSPTGGKIGTKGEKIRRRRKRAEVRDEKGRLIVPFAPHGTKMDGHGQIVPSHGVNIPIGHSHVPRSMKEPMALPLPVPEPNSSTPKIHPLPLQIHPNPHLPQIHPDHPQIHPQIHPPPHHRLQFPIIIGKDQMAKAAEGNGTANNPLENNKMEGQNKGGGAKEEMPSHNEIDVKLVKDAKKHFAGIAVPFYKMSPNGASGTLNSAVIEKAAKMLRGKK